MNQFHTPTAVERLSEILKPGDTIYCTVAHAASNGMSRHIKFFIVSGKGIRNITHDVGEVAGYKQSEKTGGLVVSGAGMDMGFHVVYSLSRTLFKDGHKCTGSDGRGHYTRQGSWVQGKDERRCPSNDHTNDYGRLSREYDETHAPLDGTEHPLSGDASYEARSAYISARQDWIKAQPTYDRKRMHSDGGYALNHSWL